MGQDKMLVGCGGLGSDPEAVERIDAPGRGMPLPQVAPHSAGQFDTMHGIAARPKLEEFGDRESGTATIEEAVRRAGAENDDDVFRYFAPHLKRRYVAHRLGSSELAALDAAVARTAHTDQSGKVELHNIVCAKITEIVRDTGKKPTYIDALNAVIAQYPESFS